MKILVTGGTGVIGTGLIPELLRRNHSVRLLSRHADEDAAQWSGVDAFRGNVTDAPSLYGAASDCDAVIHIAGIASEQPPDLTFAAVNVDGTRNVLAEAERAGVSRFLFVSSLGADRGTSEYHKSKFAAEDVVERSPLAWTIVRPGAVYGPGDEVISTIFKMVRSLPAIPVVDDGEQAFQPIWFEDLARAIATLVERADAIRRTYELAGAERTSLNDLLRRLGDVTGRNVARVPVPMALASIGARIASLATDVPIDDVKLSMLRDDNVLADGAHPLADLGIDPTPIDRGLRMLAGSMPEVLPEDGVGAMHHKRFWADIAGSRLTAASLLSHFREHVSDVMPIDIETRRIEAGATLNGHLPLRGDFQVRVERDEPTRIVLATVEGHPIAGVVEFSTSDVENGGVRFAVDVFSRAANLLDFIAMKAAGDTAQSANWRIVVRRMIEASGGTSDGVHEETRTLGDGEAHEIERSVRRMVQERKRDMLGAP